MHVPRITDPGFLYPSLSLPPSLSSLPFQACVARAPPFQLGPSAAALSGEWIGTSAISVKEEGRERNCMKKGQRERERQRPVWTLIGKVSLGHGERRPRKGVTHTRPFKEVRKERERKDSVPVMRAVKDRLPRSFFFRTPSLFLLATVALWSLGDSCYVIGERGRDMARGLKPRAAPAQSLSVQNRANSKVSACVTHRFISFQIHKKLS